MIICGSVRRGLSALSPRSALQSFAFVASQVIHMYVYTCICINIYIYIYICIYSYRTYVYDYRTGEMMKIMMISENQILKLHVLKQSPTKY